MRIGEALSKPYFESGNFAIRLRIGRIVEEAAARGRLLDRQIAALIDSIGWSLVELGDLSDAEREINHGLQLAQEEGNNFYIAKALRHLGVISRRRERYDLAADYYNRSEAASSEIADTVDRKVMLAGLNYARASLAFHRSSLDEASTFVDAALKDFEELSDDYRINNCRNLKGDILLSQGKTDQAKDLYRSVFRLADQNTQKLQYVRAGIGVAGIYLGSSKWVEARGVLDSLAKLDLRDLGVESAKVQKLIARLPK